jgi:hypothetical protein
MTTFTDALTAVATAHDADVQAAQDAGYKAGATAKATELQPELDAALGRATAAEAKVTDLQKRLEQLTPKPAPAPTTKTLFGACPIGGGSSVAAAKTVAAKWGDHTAVRMFNSGGTLSVAADPALGLVHTSYKPDIAKFLAGDPATIAAAKAGIATARKGDVLEAWHEYDVKERHGTAPCDRATFAQFKKAFYDLVHATNPGVLVATTIALPRFDDNPVDPWFKSLAGDILGVDFDGSRNVTRYPAWTTYPAKIAAYIKGSSYQGWAVPEFIHERIPTDPDGTQRAAFLTAGGTAMKAAGALYVLAFEYEGSGGRPTNPLTTTAEVAAWKTLRGD